MMQFKQNKFVFYLWIFLSALTLAFSFPKFNLYLFAPFFLIPLGYSILNKISSLKMGIIWGFTYFGIIFYWLPETIKKFGGLPFPFALFLFLLLLLYLSIYYVFLFFLAQKFSLFENPSFRKGLLFAFLWTGIEFLKAHFLSGLPWAETGYLFIHFKPFLLTASLWGIWGLSFSFLLLSYFFYSLFYQFFLKIDPIKPLSLKNLLPYFAFFCLVFLYSGIYSVYLKKQTGEAPSLSLALLQGNVPQEIKLSGDYDYSLKVYKNLIKEALQFNNNTESLDLLILPETAFNFYFNIPSDYVQELKKILKTVRNVPVIFGTFLVSPEFWIKNHRLQAYNSMVLWEKGEFLDYYNKHHLVPFGEYTPFSQILLKIPFLKRVIFNTLISGKKKLLVLKQKGKKVFIIPLICFESMFPEIPRSYREGDFILVITNDAWFGKSSALYQHFMGGVLRAVEEGKYLAQCANTGITGIVNPWGTVVSHLPVNKEAVLYGKVKLLRFFTPYKFFGDFIGWIGIIFIVLLLALHLLNKRSSILKHL